ncbi:hypothetical protein VPH35_055843 [Triticum aestivum]
MGRWIEHGNQSNTCSIPTRGVSMTGSTCGAAAAYEASEWRRPDLCSEGAIEARTKDSSPASEKFIGQIDTKAPPWT